MWPKCFHVGSCALFILVGWLLVHVFGGVCATPINMSIKGPEKPSAQPLTENPAALSLKLIKGQNNITDPKNTLSFRSRMCTQRIRSLIIYCAVNLELPKETDGLGPTLQRQQVSRIHVGIEVWHHLKGGVGACPQHEVFTLRRRACVCRCKNGSHAQTLAQI